MGKLSRFDREQATKIFASDFDTINDAVAGQLKGLWQSVRERTMLSVGIKEASDEAIKLEKEIADMQMELTRIREKMQHEISMKARRLEDVKRDSLKEYSGPPDAEMIKELGFDHDAPVEKRDWFGFKIRTKLDAMTALRLSGEIDIGSPYRVLQQIAKSVSRELILAGTHEDVKAIYEKFHSLNFRQFGVDLPPRLMELVKLSGDKLLEVGLMEKEGKETKALPARVESEVSSAAKRSAH